VGFLVCGWPVNALAVMLAAFACAWECISDMPRFLYSASFYLILPLVLLRLLWRGRLVPAYRRRIAERFGFFKAPAQKNGLWVHAVSVGESIAAAPVIEHFLVAHPNLPVVVTTMTPTGSERVKAMFGDRVFHVYAPYDLPDAVERFLKRVRPSVAVIMETEIWPNMVCQTAAKGIPVILANISINAVGFFAIFAGGGAVSG
jgi:3-deoxy-D-manno-octulosonic-acid transferase